jgi:CUB domain
MDYWIRIVGPERTRLIVQFQKINIEQQDECLYDYISLQDEDLYPYLSSIELEMDPNRMPMAIFGSHQQKNTHSFDDDYQNDEVTTAERLENRRRRAAIKNEFNGVLKDDEKRKPVSNANGNDLFSSHNDPDSGGDEPSFTPYVRWCGNHDSNMSKFDFISSTNEVILHFHSDHSITAMGFAAMWNSVDVSGCPYQTLTSREGVIHSPNYPHFLLNNLDCTFTLQAPQDKKVWLEFQDYDLVQEALVELDLGSGGFRPFQTENHINDGAFVSLGETLILRIRSGNEPRGKGFKAVYKTSECCYRLIYYFLHFLRQITLWINVCVYVCVCS